MENRRALLIVPLGYTVYQGFLAYSEGHVRKSAGFCQHSRRLCRNQGYGGTAGWWAAQRWVVRAPPGPLTAPPAQAPFVRWLTAAALTPRTPALWRRGPASLLELAGL